MLNIENSNSEIFIEIIKKLSERILEQEKMIIKLELEISKLSLPITINTITVLGSNNKIYQNIDKFTFDSLLDKD